MVLRRLLLCLVLAHLASSKPGAALAEPRPLPENPLHAEQRKRDAVHRDALPLFTASAANAEAWFIWEGLPHPTWEKERFADEQSRKPTAKLHGDTFYSRAAALRPEDRTAFTDLLSRAETYAVHSGTKLCGGFHADYAIEWRANQRVYRALVCFGCHEIKLVSDDITLLCDVPKPAYGALATLLKPYRRERPGDPSTRSPRRRALQRSPPNLHPPVHPHHRRPHIPLLRRHGHHSRPRRHTFPPPRLALPPPSHLSIND